MPTVYAAILTKRLPSHENADKRKCTKKTVNGDHLMDSKPKVVTVHALDQKYTLPYSPGVIKEDTQ